MRDSIDQSDQRMKFTVRARLRSFVFAGRGLHRLMQDEHNAQLHLVASIVAVAAGFAFRIAVADWRWIVTAIVMVWLAEAFNTAIEELCDRVNPEFDAAIGRVKDLAAGAVLVASIGAAMIGLLTFLPYVRALL